MNIFKKVFFQLLNTNILYWVITLVFGFFGFIYSDLLTSKETFLNNISIQVLYVLIIPLVLLVINKIGNILITVGIPITVRNRLSTLFKPWKKLLVIYLLLIIIGLILFYVSLQYQENNLLRIITGLWIGAIIGYSSKIFRIYSLIYSYEKDLLIEQEKLKKQKTFNQKFDK